MKKISTILIATSVTLVNLIPVYGQENNQQKIKWTIGGGLIVYQSPYEGEGNRIIPFPYISYDNGSVFLNGQTLGYHLNKNSESGLFVDLIGTVNDVAGVGRSSINFDLGLRAGFANKNIYFDVSVFQDVTSKHSGQRVIAKIAKPINQGILSLVPSLSAQWMSRKAVNHLYGISIEQNAEMISENRESILPVYEITSSEINFNANLTLTYQVNQKWSMVAISGVNYLGSNIRDNPSVVKEYELYGGVGIAYSF